MDKLVKFMNGVVFFTHFVYVDYTPNTDQLRTFFQMGAAVICKDNQSGIDNVIPVLLANDEITFLLGQSKLHSSKSSAHTSSEYKMTPQYSGISAAENFNHPYFCLHAEFGEDVRRATFMDLKYSLGGKVSLEILEMQIHFGRKFRKILKVINCTKNRARKIK